MFFDWIAREGWIIVNWWLISTLGGLTALPLIMRLLPSLPDKGYTLARGAGWLMIGFVFWLLGILGFLNNSVGSIVFAWGLVLAVALIVNFRFPLDWQSWWKENRKLIVVTEVLFVVLLVSFALFRAHQNNFASTEKPMDLAFMSAIQHSQSFPPNDPWLSGYSISYYYFGYLLAAMNSMLAGVPSTIGYNMHLALLFALAGISSFGIGYNLVRSRKASSRAEAMVFGGLAAFFLLWMSNFYMPLVEMPYKSGEASADYLCFWDTKDLAQYPPNYVPGNAFDPSQYESWFWFGASRTITERALSTPEYSGSCADSAYQQTGERINEVIDEFPAFSFILGDSHPHVMGLPFVLLALGIALNVVLSSDAPNRWQTLFYGVSVGALIFFNTWDAPIYITVIVGAEFIRRLSSSERDWLSLVKFGGAILILGIIAFSPFLIGFRSQAGGILPNVLHPTRPQQLFLMFGPFILLLGFYLIVEVWRGLKSSELKPLLGGGLAAGVFMTLIFVMLFLLLVGTIAWDYQETINRFVAQYGGWDEVTRQVLDRWLMRGLTPLLLFITLGLGFSRLFAGGQPLQNRFALLLLICGLGLVIIPEFVYLRDNFGTRMNTVFKFYYQAWVMFSISAAYGVYTITRDLTLPKPNFVLQGFFVLMLVVIMLAGSIYSVFGYYNRMVVSRETDDSTVTLDGGRNFRIPIEDYEAIMCLKDLVGNADVVVAEANPESSPSTISVNYNPIHGRVGSLTGIPVVIGWTGHESQWRGSSYYEARGTRTTDLDMLYTDSRLAVILEIVDRYGIDYIIFGNTERQHYGSGAEITLQDNFEVVCEATSPFGSATTRIYRVGNDG